MEKLLKMTTLAVSAFFAVVAPSTAADNPYGAPPWTIGFSQDTMDHPWRAFMVTSAEAQAKKYPELIKEFIYTDAKGTNEKQIADIEDLIARGVDLIMMSPREAQALVPAVEAIKKAGIPLVVLDREIVGEDYNVFIGGNNLSLAEGLGKHVLGSVGEKFSYLELEGIPGATPTIQRQQGFAAQLEGKTDIKLLDARPANYDLAPAIPIVEDWLTRYRDQFQVIYAHNDPMILGAINVLKEAGYKPGDVYLIGVDGQREAFQAIKDGWLQATSIYATGGAIGLDMAVRVLKGEPVPKRITTETPIVTKDNVDEFYNADHQYVR
ncbi:substrate-binding domain-containing protein [Rhizobium leguminosarum]|uniref:substrate-binding domain-containing protein n=1 Tax=Rhizobium TaxID=379 RepID=UPI001440FC3D|nr:MULTISPECIES: substrate-binding domain-containing protein [Rhizobium]MBY3186573.1 substrate-binding domain-containing protein [Rhizobium laguerreae]MBY5782066.1 substrate-binding domain-containing protein [Rhizobium leguminosarum]MBY5839113.1 substrate-binding domain-containing protein [Rhizobium leguminosarum]MBY5870035.1 substrate-binding domain-containing protein [Rhizobium leguminosarum]NKK82091.1 substrate-binding domain-containing protein [Rhizobium leguminosarum bv. viciae]